MTRAAGLDGLRIHDLRHRFASVGAGASLGLSIVGRLFGHSATTARYSHLDADPLRRAVEPIGASIDGAMNRGRGRRRAAQEMTGGKRGPRKGDGGRPASSCTTIRTDGSSSRRCGWATIQRPIDRSTYFKLLDFLLTPHDSIEVALGTRMLDGVAWGCLTMTNTEPPREPSSNCPPDRQALSAPGRRAFRHSRLKHLQEKVGFYQRAKLSEREARFYSLTQLGLDFIVGGRREAGPVLKMLGWEMTAMARQRLADILRPGGSITPRPDASID